MRGHWESSTRRLNKHYQSGKTSENFIEIPGFDDARATYSGMSLSIDDFENGVLFAYTKRLGNTGTGNVSDSEWETINRITKVIGNRTNLSISYDVAFNGWVDSSMNPVSVSGISTYLIPYPNRKRIYSTNGYYNVALGSNLTAYWRNQIARINDFYYFVNGSTGYYLDANETTGNTFGYTRILNPTYTATLSPIGSDSSGTATLSDSVSGGTLWATQVITATPIGGTYKQCSVNMTWENPTRSAVYNNSTQPVYSFYRYIAFTYLLFVTGVTTSDISGTGLSYNGTVIYPLISSRGVKVK